MTQTLEQSAELLARLAEIEAERIAFLPGSTRTEAPAQSPGQKLIADRLEQMNSTNRRYTLGRLFDIK